MTLTMKRILSLSAILGLSTAFLAGSIVSNRYHAPFTAFILPKAGLPSAPGTVLGETRRAGKDGSLFSRQLAEAAKRRGLNITDGFSAAKNMGAESPEKENPRPKYQRIEEWDAEQKQKAKSGTLSWEEKVQFDGQRHGNQYRQNEILRKHLY